MTDTERIEYLEQVVALHGKIAEGQQEVQAETTETLRAMSARIQNLERALADHLENGFDRGIAQRRAA